jgi:hypothetical protein
MGQAMNDDVKRDEGLDTLTADHDPPPPPAPAPHQPVEQETAAKSLAGEPATEIGVGAIRGAYLARRLAVETEGVGGMDHETVAVSTLVRGAYVAHLATPDSGSAGDEHGGSTDLLRGIYAARVTAAAKSVATATPRARLAQPKKAPQRKSAASKAKKAAPPRRAKKKVAGRAKTSGRTSAKRGRR